MTKESINRLLRQHPSTWVFTVLKHLDGFYECPKDTLGNRLGPLVGYAGSYESHSGPKQFVGDVYCNFSVAEQHPFIIECFVEQLAHQLEKHFGDELHELITQDRIVIAGPQMGGVATGFMLARHLGCRFAYIEKKITQLANNDQREQSELAFIRHSVKKGDLVIICEDVSNNFSTTAKTIDVILAAGAKPLGLATLLNRSMTITNTFQHENTQLPVIPLVHKPFDEYEQTNQFVLSDIEKGNVIWKPKNDWTPLAEAMKKHAA